MCLWRAPRVLVTLGELGITFGAVMDRAREGDAG